MRPSPRHIAVAVLVALSACTVDSGRPLRSSEEGRVSGTVRVLAASSLTEPLTSIARKFEAANPGVRVSLTFDGSSRLVTEILEGVPADVLASADEANLAQVVAAGRTHGKPVTIASNELEIVVPQGNPGRIAGLRDLRDGVVLALCRPTVPCGAYAARAFHLAGLEVPSAGQEDSVKAVLTKVQLGEADAGIVYRTDVQAAKGVSGVALAAAEQVRATYPASVLADAPNPRAGAAFLAFLRSEAAQAILAGAGFGRP